MIEFEEWDKKNKINYAVISGCKELCVKNERRKAWKAALEWAKTQHSVNDTKPYRTIDVDIIDEELKSE